MKNIFVCLLIDLPVTYKGLRAKFDTLAYYNILQHSKHKIQGRQISFSRIHSRC